jgi:tRNA pseudouridine55 synthase
VRALCGGARAGHAGTLDPAASGLLIVALGAATRLLEFLPSQPKHYTFIVRFGIETDTLDEEGSVVREGGKVPSLEEITAVLPRFTGTIMQEPPRFSALKQDGRRAYDRARNNEAFSLKSREITVHSLTIKNSALEETNLVFEVSCQAGTYVRSLARDIALALGTYGHARRIQRTAIGPFSLADAKDFSTLVSPTELIPIKTMFKTCDCIIIDSELQIKISQGKDIPLSHAGEIGKPVFAFNAFKKIVAILIKTDQGTYHPSKVFL